MVKVVGLVLIVIVRALIFSSSACETQSFINYRFEQASYWPEATYIHTFLQLTLTHICMRRWIEVKNRIGSMWVRVVRQHNTREATSQKKKQKNKRAMQQTHACSWRCSFYGEISTLLASCRCVFCPCFSFDIAWLPHTGQRLSS